MDNSFEVHHVFAFGLVVYPFDPYVLLLFSDPFLALHKLLVFILEILHSNPRTLLIGPHFDVHRLGFLLDLSDFVSLFLLLNRAVQHSLVRVVDLLELVALVQQLLDFDLVLLRKVLRVDHLLEIRVVVEFLFDVLDLFVVFSDLSNIGVQLVLLLNVYFVGRCFDLLFGLDGFFDESVKFLEN